MCYTQLIEKHLTLNSRGENLSSSSYIVKKGIFSMTEYVYIAADTPLRAGLIDGRRSEQQPNEYPLAIQDYFYFEKNIDEDTGETVNFSIHFPFKTVKYQVASIALDLPSFDKRNTQSPRFKNTLKALEDYIHEQFENGCVQLMILYSLNSYEDEPLKANEEISIADLKSQDLYYAESRLLRIKK